MRWVDNSMGSNFDYGWSDINQAFAPGTVGMYVNGSDVFTNLVQASNIDPSIYGVTTIPLANNKNAAVLGGGTLAAVRRTPRRRAVAAVKWIDFYYEQPLINKAKAIRNAKTLVASKQPVGVPALPVFNKAQYNSRERLDQALHQRPLGADQPFTSGIFKQKVVARARGLDAERLPLARCGRQAVLTTQNVNIPQMLNDANSAAQTAIISRQVVALPRGRLGAGDRRPAGCSSLPGEAAGSVDGEREAHRAGATRGAGAAAPGARLPPGCAAAASRPSSSCCRCWSSSGRSRGTRSCAR